MAIKSAARKTTATPETGKTGYPLGMKLTNEQHDKLFATVTLPALRNGATVRSQRVHHGRQENIRLAARRAGYASIADAVRGDKTFSTIKVKGVRPAIVAKRINEARTEGDSWNTLRMRTGMDRDDMTALLKKHGHEAVTSGRVITTEKGKARVAKLAAEAAAAAAKPARKRAPRKAKVTA